MRAQDEWHEFREPVRGPAQEAVDRLLNQAFLDELVAKTGTVQLTGEGGFLPSSARPDRLADLRNENLSHGPLAGH